MSITRVVEPTTRPVTTAEAKLHLRVTHSAEDAYIDALIDSAVNLAEHIMGRSVMPQKWLVQLDEFPDGAIRLGYPPVTSVDWVKYLPADGGAEATVAQADYQLDADLLPGWVRPVYGKSWPATYDAMNAVKVQFVAGWANAAAVPQPIKQWILLTVGAWYVAREAVQGRQVTELPRGFHDGLLDRYRLWGV